MRVGGQDTADRVILDVRGDDDAADQGLVLDDLRAVHNGLQVGLVAGGGAVEDHLELIDLRVTAGADLADVTLMMADYNLTALAVTDSASNLVGAISVDDLLEALVPENWRNRAEASSGV